MAGCAHSVAVSFFKLALVSLSSKTGRGKVTSWTRSPSMSMSADRSQAAIALSKFIARDAPMSRYWLP